MRYRPLAALLLAFGLLLGQAAQAADTKPQKAQPILTVDQVKVGMKGYGMTVFHGTKIEPFSVEVVTINANETPNRAVIWVRCSDKRMIKTGPVQGMSGSPIYLWDKNEPQVPGKGGKLIGAFAFGYAETNDCIVGVQPIQYMRKVGERATAKNRPSIASVKRPGEGLAQLTRLNKAAQKVKLPKLAMARLEATRKLYESITPSSAKKLAKKKLQADQADKDDADNDAGDRVGSFQPNRMMVPLAVGSSDLAALLSPTLRPYGIQPFAAGGGALGGKPPRGFDVKNVKLEPGSALVVPFAWGDIDLSGAGTVTDVLPDGTVLGFGHAMDGVGVTAIPMATGYVHFIVSSTKISYKRAGTLALKGALVQDEQAAVAGTSAKPYTSLPVTVKVNIEGQPKYTYNHRVVNHPTMTPAIAGAVLAMSGSAVQSAPRLSTERYKLKLKFSGGHEIDLGSSAVGKGGMAAAAMTMSVVGAMMNNPYEKVELKGVEATVDMDYGLDAYAVRSAKPDKTEYAPGETVNITLELLGLQEKIVKKKIKFKLPDDVPAGQQMLMLATASSYTQMMLSLKPELNQIKSVKGLARGLQAIYSTNATSLYAVMATGKLGGIAIDGKRMPDIPLSKAAILAGNATENEVALFEEYQIKEIPMKRVMLGDARIQINIKQSQGSR